MVDQLVEDANAQVGEKQKQVNQALAAELGLLVKKVKDKIKG